uniref:Uncharacterized protein n=1 Tax=Oryza punctata TaxID=4537 RepID=A0A0E0MHD3_ORYPU
MAAKMGGVPGEDASVLDFCNWSQEAGCAVSDCATAYGDCCARVSAAFVLGLLKQNGCEHVARFPEFAKGDWEVLSISRSSELLLYIPIYYCIFYRVARCISVRNRLKAESS